MARGWKLILSRVNLGDPALASLYLGCIHESKRLTLPSGKKARAVVYGMEEYLKSTVEKCRKLVKQSTGIDFVLRKASTPFLSEDHKGAPAARPAGD